MWGKQLLKVLDSCWPFLVSVEVERGSSLPEFACLLKNFNLIGVIWSCIHLLILRSLTPSSEKVPLSLQHHLIWGQHQLLKFPRVGNPVVNYTTQNSQREHEKDTSWKWNPTAQQKQVWFIWMVSLNKSTKVTNWSTKRNLTRSATPRVSAKCTINGCRETPKVWIQFVFLNSVHC